MKILALIRNEIERLKEETHNIRCQHNEKYCISYDDAFNDLLSTLDTLPDEPVSNDLEKAADDYIGEVTYNAGHPGWDWETHDIIEAFIAGAEWQKRQTMKDAIDIKVIESYNPICEPNKRLHGISFIYDCKNDNQYLIAGDRAKIIIVKEEE